MQRNRPCSDPFFVSFGATINSLQFGPYLTRIGYAVNHGFPSVSERVGTTGSLAIDNRHS